MLLSKRVLLIDLDPQCNASSGLGQKPAARHPLVSQTPLRESLLATDVPGLDILPGSRNFQDVELLAGAENRTATLRSEVHAIPVFLIPPRHSVI